MFKFLKRNRKYLFIIIFGFVIILFILKGCHNSSNTSLERGSINVVCSSGNLGDAVIVTKSKIEANYDKNKKLINYKTVTIETNNNNKLFIERKKMYDKTYKNIKSDENTLYDYKVYSGKKTFEITTVYKNVDLKQFGEEEQKRFELKEFIKFYEKNKYKCDIKGIDRKDI